MYNNKNLIYTIIKIPKIYHTAVCEPCTETSRIACSWHFTSSVGHRVNDEKKAAKNPADAFPKVDNCSTL